MYWAYGTANWRFTVVELNPVSNNSSFKMKKKWNVHYILLPWKSNLSLDIIEQWITITSFILTIPSQIYLGKKVRASKIPSMAGIQPNIVFLVVNYHDVRVTYLYHIIWKRLSLKIPRGWTPTLTNNTNILSHIWSAVDNFNSRIICTYIHSP